MASSSHPTFRKDSTAHVDADYAGCTIARDDQETLSASRVRTGFVNLCLVVHHLAEQAQTEICLSSTASEYVAFSMAMRAHPNAPSDLRDWTNLQIEDYQSSLVRSTVFEDNQGCISQSTSPRCPHNKYLSLKYHFFVTRSEEKELWRSILNQRFKSGHFHKGLPSVDFKRIRVCSRMVIGTPIHFIGRGGKILRRLSFSSGKTGSPALYLSMDQVPARKALSLSVNQEPARKATGVPNYSPTYVCV
jgi:hypothetical protein